MLPKLNASLYGALGQGENNQILSSNISLNQTLFDGGLKSAELMKARNERASAEKEVRKVKSRIIRETKQAYMKVLIFYNLYLLYQDSYERLEKHGNDIKRQYESGTLSRLDLVQSTIALNKVKSILIKFKEQYIINQDIFNRILKRDNTTVLKLEPLESLPEISMTRSEWIRMGLRNNPELEVLNKITELNEYSINKLKTKKYPQVDVGLAYDLQKDVYIDTSRLLMAGDVE